MSHETSSKNFPLTRKYLDLFYNDNLKPEVSDTERIVFNIYHDICGRRGIKYEFERFVQEDHNVSEELLSTWMKIVEGN